MVLAELIAYVKVTYVIFFKLFTQVRHETTYFARINHADFFTVEFTVELFTIHNSSESRFQHEIFKEFYWLFIQNSYFILLNC